jgi:hypothetical protein
VTDRSSCFPGTHSSIVRRLQAGRTTMRAYDSVFKDRGSECSEVGGGDTSSVHPSRQEVRFVFFCSEPGDLSSYERELDRCARRNRTQEAVGTNSGGLSYPQAIPSKVEETLGIVAPCGSLAGATLLAGRRNILALTPLSTRFRHDWSFCVHQ